MRLEDAVKAAVEKLSRSPYIEGEEMWVESRLYDLGEVFESSPGRVRWVPSSGDLIHIGKVRGVDYYVLRLPDRDVFIAFGWTSEEFRNRGFFTFLDVVEKPERIPVYLFARLVESGQDG